jgi:hypothetical protein
VKMVLCCMCTEKQVKAIVVYFSIWSDNIPEKHLHPSTH